MPMWARHKGRHQPSTDRPFSAHIVRGHGSHPYSSCSARELEKASLEGPNSPSCRRISWMHQNVCQRHVQLVQAYLHALPLPEAKETCLLTIRYKRRSRTTLHEANARCTRLDLNKQIDAEDQTVVEELQHAVPFGGIFWTSSGSSVSPTTIDTRKAVL